ncbi:MAG: ABC transporter permease [Limnochordia bacterium]|nr:ABC transporter permease [Limnochordia bacterium]
MTFRSFAKQYRQSRPGMVGLGILLFFVVIAIFAPLLTSYDPLKDMNLANRMAMPAWFRIFPKYRDALQGTAFHITADEWDVKTIEGEIETAFSEQEGDDYLQLNFPEGAGKVLLTHTFGYPSDTATVFEIGLIYGISQLDSGNAALSFSIVDPNGKTYSPWKSQNHRSTMEVRKFSIDSRDMRVKTALGLGPFGDAAKTVFTSSGEYSLNILMEKTPESGPVTIDLGKMTFVVPGEVHGVLGVDHLGCDLWSQLAYGTRFALLIGLSAAFIAVVVGTTIGIISGYVGGFIDEILMRLADIMLSVPLLPILIILAAFFGKSIWNTVILIAVFAWMGTARMVRSQTLSLREQTFVEAARAAGASQTYIMWHHIMPNVLPLVFASLVLLIPSAILFESTLSFLGFGDPSTPTWGNMLQNAQNFGAFTRLAWWWILPPGLAITLLAMAFVLIGNTLNEILDPRHQER